MKTLLLTIMLAALMLTGCNQATQQEGDVASSDSSAEDPVEATTEEEAEDATPDSETVVVRADVSSSSSEGSGAPPATWDSSGDVVLGDRPETAEIAPLASAPIEPLPGLYGQAYQDSINSPSPANHARQSKIANAGQGEGANMCGIMPEATWYGEPC